MKDEAHFPEVKEMALGGSTVTAALMAGLFYSYSISVMPGLSEQSDRNFVAAMQSINERIMNRWFFIVFFGVLMFLLVSTIAHAFRPRSLRLWLIATATAIYVVGAFGVTVGANIPLNDALAHASLDAPPEELARVRKAFEGPWNSWNNVRSVSSFGAFVLLIAAYLAPDREC